LVHEAYLRLAPQEAGWASRRHFFGAASEAMRRILVDHARHRNAAKRGGGAVHTAFRTGHHEPASDEEEKLLQIHDVLDELAETDRRQAEIVKLRYFVGLSNTEIGEVLGVDERTVRRHWELAKVWLYQAITGG
jgi:RNA polymerase sigma factor (TIGR02999 family)